MLRRIWRKCQLKEYKSSKFGLGIAKCGSVFISVMLVSLTGGLILKQEVSMAKETQDQLEWITNRWNGYEEELRKLILIPIIKDNPEWDKSNAYRNLIGALDPPPQGLDILERDLRGVDLSGAQLEGADLRAANLSRSDLSEADLRKAILIKADLIDADLSQTNLNEADLWGADLSKANLYRANISNASLFQSKLSEASLIEANMREANLRNGAWGRATISNCFCMENEVKT